MHIPFTEQFTVGRQAISELAASIKSLGNGNKRSINPAVLKSVYNLGSVAQSHGISELKWIAPQPGRRAVEAVLTAKVHEQAAKRLSAPQFTETQIDGVLEMVDFDPSGQKCRIEPAIGAPITCTFPAELADTVHSLLRKTVRGIGIGKYNTETNRIESVSLKQLVPLPSLSLGRDDFYSAYSLEQLAQMQKVKPLTGGKTLAGAIPEDTDVDSFLEVIYSSRK